MTDKDVVDKVAKIFNAKTGSWKPSGYSKHKNYKRIYSVRVQGKKAITIMKKLKPYMGERRQEKIQELVTYMEKQNEPKS